jgi:AraC family transcriptional regulator of adaptative response/methylated-DNA-[protein]-cysteine methyltransferase
MKIKFPPVLNIGTSDSLYGPCTIVFNENSIFALGFCDLNEALREFKTNFKSVNLETDSQRAKELIKSIFEKGVRPKLVLLGTNFQLKVWSELEKIPKGETITYAELAIRIGKPKAARAVGNAVGANPIAYLVPCHRVVRTDKTLGGYRWGVVVKKKILGKEMI